MEESPQPGGRCIRCLPVNPGGVAEEGMWETQPAGAGARKGPGSDLGYVRTPGHRNELRWLGGHCFYFLRDMVTPG